MKARSPIRWLIVLLLAVTFVGVSYAYVQWGPLWPSSTTTFYVKYDNGTYDTAFIEAMNKWNGLSNFSFASNTSTYVDPCNSVSSPDYLNGYNFSSDDALNILFPPFEQGLDWDLEPLNSMERILNG